MPYTFIHELFYYIAWTDACIETGVSPGCVCIYCTFMLCYMRDKKLLHSDMQYKLPYTQYDDYLFVAEHTSTYPSFKDIYFFDKNITLIHLWAHKHATHWLRIPIGIALCLILDPDLKIHSFYNMSLYILYATQLYESWIIHVYVR